MLPDLADWPFHLLRIAILVGIGHYDGSKLITKVSRFVVCLLAVIKSQRDNLACLTLVRLNGGFIQRGLAVMLLLHGHLETISLSTSLNKLVNGLLLHHIHACSVNSINIA